MLINDLTDFGSKKKRKYNTTAEDGVKRRNISKSIKNEKDDLQFVHGLVSILKVKVENRWGKSRIKNDLMSYLDNCTQEQFEASTKYFYVGCSLIGERKESNYDKNESRREHPTRVLNDVWVEMHFNKPFCIKLDTKFHQWFTVSKEKVDEIKVKMEEDQGESIQFIHKYRDAMTNEIKY